MVALPQFYDATGTTQISATISASVNAGSSVAAVEYELWNAKGGTADTLMNARLRAEAWNGSAWVISGEPCLDEGWIKVQLTGINNTADPNMVQQTTGYRPLGTNRTIVLEDIPQNCARIMNVRIDVPAGQSTAAPSTRLVVVHSENSTSLSELDALASGGGVLPERFTPGARKLRAGVTVTASGGATVVVSEREFTFGKSNELCESSEYVEPPSTVTLNQTAADGALAAGQSYIALLTQAVATAAVTVTKGNKAAAPTAPNIPVDPSDSGGGLQIFIARVTVAYQSGGTSIINQANVDQTGLAIGNYALYAGSGLNVMIGSGQAITTADTHTFTTAQSTLAVADAATSHIWVRPDGTFSAVVSSVPLTVPPEVGAVYVGNVTTSGGAITAINGSSERPRFVGRAIDEYVMKLQYMGTLAVVTDADWDYLPFDAYLESVEVQVAIGAVGSTIFDVGYRPRTTSFTPASTSIYESQATWDQRPTLTSVLSVTTPFVKHEQREFSRGTRFSFDIDAVPATPGSDAIVHLHFRRK